MLLQQSLQYALSHAAELQQALGRHLQYVLVALGIGMVVCIPLGVWTSRARSRRVAMGVINAFNALRVIPSLAVLFLAIPYFGLTFTSSAIALTILALPPILINTDAAFRTLDPAVKESARGMGMTERQILWRIEVPLAIPVILTGIRTATLEVIASATLAAFIGGGGLGLYITRGFALYDTSILLVGAVPIALLALVVEVGLSMLQHALEPPDRRKESLVGERCQL